jgi:hypothetical protein
MQGAGSRLTRNETKIRIVLIPIKTELIAGTYQGTDA